MNKVVKKWFWIWQQDNEKDFLKKMARQGYRLVQVDVGKYTFEKDTSRKIIYQMDFRGFGDKISEAEYLQTFNNAGWDFVTKMGGWYYFCQEQKEGIDLALFDDNESKRKLYKRLLLFLFITGFPLYYLTMIVLPAIQFVNIYFPFQILVALLLIPHFLAVLVVVSLYIKTKNDTHR